MVVHEPVSMRIHLLGGFRICAGEQTIHPGQFHLRRSRGLLKLLALAPGHSLHRDQLIEALWPDADLETVTNSLYQAVYAARRVLADHGLPAQEILQFSEEFLSLGAGMQLWIDIEAFEDSAAIARSAQDPQACRAALELYAGDLLPEDRYEDWAASRREGLRQECLRLRLELAALLEGRGEHDLAITQLELALVSDPVCEEAHAGLMRLYAASGQRSAALVQYETCRQALEQELGVRPSSETTKLYQQISEGRFSAQPVRDLGFPEETQPATAPLHPAKLPTFLIPFVGRHRLLTAIRERLQEPGCRLLTLVGLGGSGKTRLAVKAAAGLAPDYPDGVYFVPLAGVQEIESIVPAVAQAVGFTFSGQLEPRQQLLNFLRDKALLLVLDNFEHLVEGAKIVREMLEAAPRIKILVTSRVGLNLQGENLLPVAGMSVPQEPPVESAEMLQYSSVKLFLEGARRAAPAFEPAQADLEQIARICRVLGGMPLGILLAATWMRLLTPSEIADEIAVRSLDFLESEWVDAPQRQRSLLAVVEYSYRLLGEGEQAVFAALSVFRGGFSYPAARQVAGATLRDLVKLLDYSLLERNPDGRYGLHEVLRQFGAEMLAMQPDGGQAVHDLYSAYFSAALRDWESKLKSAQQRDSLAEVQLELQNIRAAWSWALEQGRVDRLAEGMWGLYWVYDYLDLQQEGAAAFERALKRLDQLDLTRSPQGLVLRANLLTGLGDFNLNVAFSKEQILQSLEVLEGAARVGQDVRRYQAYALADLAWLHIYSVDFDAAQKALDAALVLSRGLDASWERAYVLAGLGGLVQAQGDLHEAVGFKQQSLAIFQELGDERKTIIVANNLAWSLSMLGRLEEAERLARDGVARSRGLGSHGTLASGLRVLADVLLRSGRPAEALVLLEECTALCEQTRNKNGLARTMMRLGRANLDLGRYLPAGEALHSGLNLSREAGWQSGIGVAAGLLGDLALVGGDLAKANQWYQESVNALGDNAARGRTVTRLALAGLKMGELPQARRFLGEALRIALASRDFDNPLHALVSAALFAAEEGLRERAVELYALASRYPYVSNSVFFQDLAGKSIAALAESLPSETAGAAQARGGSRDLWATIEELAAEFGE